MKDSIRKRRLLRDRRRSGAAMVEYIIIVVIVAIAGIAIFGVFGDTIRAKLGGAVEELGGDTSAKDAALDKTSEQWLKDLDKDGATGGSGGGPTGP
jgi:Flp pilus assembly pilin Flp